MDKDRIQGSVKQVVGSVKEVVGKVLGDQKTETDGKAEKAKYRMPSAAQRIRCGRPSKSKPCRRRHRGFRWWRRFRLPPSGCRHGVVDARSTRSCVLKSKRGGTS